MLRTRTNRFFVQGNTSCTEVLSPFEEDMFDRRGEELVSLSSVRSGFVNIVKASIKSRVIDSNLKSRAACLMFGLMPLCFWGSRDLQADWVFFSLSENDGRAGIQRVVAVTFSTNQQMRAAKTRARAIRVSERSFNLSRSRCLPSSAPRSVS